MKVSAEHYNVKVTIEIDHDNTTVEEVVCDLIRPLLLALGYGPDIVDKWIEPQ